MAILDSFLEFKKKNETHCHERNFRIFVQDFSKFGVMDHLKNFETN
jgi:hypothetical protein